MDEQGLIINTSPSSTLSQRRVPAAFWATHAPPACASPSAFASWGGRRGGSRGTCSRHPSCTAGMTFLSPFLPPAAKAASIPRRVWFVRFVTNARIPRGGSRLDRPRRHVHGGCRALAQWRVHGRRLGRRLAPLRFGSDAAGRAATAEAEPNAEPFGAAMAWHVIGQLLIPHALIRRVALGMRPCAALVALEHAPTRRIAGGCARVGDALMPATHACEGPRFTMVARVAPRVEACDAVQLCGLCGGRHVCL